MMRRTVTREATNVSRNAKRARRAAAQASTLPFAASPPRVALISSDADAVLFAEHRHVVAGVAHEDVRESARSDRERVRDPDASPRVVVEVAEHEDVALPQAGELVEDRGDRPIR